MSFVRLISLLALLPVAALPCREVYGAPADCAGVALSGGDAKLALARVTAGAPRVNFIANPGRQTPNCPSAENACALKAFLVPGDEALVIGGESPYLCATFKSPRGAETSGWLPRAALSLAPPEPAPAANWAGKWRRDGEAEIVLQAHGDEVAASGEASWGGGDPERVRTGAVNTGEISGSGEPKAGVLAIGYADGAAAPPANGADCAARLQLFGRYLLVEDNGACGGMNVTFAGIYVRAGDGK